MPINYEKIDSPGFRRLKERLGPEGFEALRQDTLRLQREALASVKPPTAVPEINADQETVRNVIRGKRK
jgi:hypothetical protein